MNLRNYLLVLLHLAAAAALICAATVLQAGSSFETSALMTAQRHTPALWLLDAAMALSLVQTAILLQLRQKEQSRLERLRHQTQDQIEALTRSVESRDRVNTEQTERLDDLQQELNARREAFETEARRLTEQAFHALSGQVDANTRQLDAVNLALQYHRAQLQQVNQGVRLLKSGSEAPRPFPILTPDEIAAIEGRELPEAIHRPVLREEALSTIDPAPQDVAGSVWSSSTQNAPSTIVSTAGNFPVDTSFFEPLTDSPVDSGTEGHKAPNEAPSSNASSAQAYLDALVNRPAEVQDTPSSSNLDADTSDLVPSLADAAESRSPKTESSSEWHRRL